MERICWFTTANSDTIVVVNPAILRAVATPPDFSIRHNYDFFTFVSGLFHVDGSDVDSIHESFSSSHG